MLFHLNLISVDERERPAVIERCYWPLLRAVESSRFPIGVEMSGETLAAIDQLDRGWIVTLRQLIDGYLVEPVASGEAQIIGPLAPFSINEINLRLGNETFERLLGRRAVLVMAAEQCLSLSMIDHYIDAGFSAYIADWDSVHHAHPDWDPLTLYAPSLTASAKGRTLPVLWSMAIAGQKLQRLAYSLDDRAAYWQWLDRRLAKPVPALNLYCNATEVFDFCRGRADDTDEIKAGSEWRAIESLFYDLARDRRIACMRPSDVIAALPPAMPPLTIATAALPLPAKEPEKFHVARWAAAGHDNIGINGRCLALVRRARDSARASDEDWRELCSLHSSDFRMTANERRRADYRERLRACEERWEKEDSLAIATPRQPDKDSLRLNPRPGGLISLEAEAIGVELDAHRGLAIRRLWNEDDPAQWLLGTITFGYYNDTRLGMDFYSGHAVFQQQGKPEITDLMPGDAWLHQGPDRLSVYTEIATPVGPIEKELRLHRAEPRIDLLYRLNWPAAPIGVLRLGYITLNPQAFNAEAMWYATHNGGDTCERFNLNGVAFDHGRPAGHLFSASSALGMTEDVLALGDDRRFVKVTARREQTAVVPQVAWRRLRDEFFLRIAFSAGELDSTVTMHEPSRAERWPLTLAFSIEIASTV